MKVLICDDNEMCAKMFEVQILEIANRNNIEINTETVNSGNQLLFFIETKYSDVDLIMMDQHMPGLSGIETAKEIIKLNIPADIIFYSADETQAVNAYDVDALHYIVKGKTSMEKIEEIFIKAMRKHEERKKKTLSLYYAGVRKNIPIEDILYFSVSNRIVNVIYYEKGQQKVFEFYSSLSKLSEKLDDKEFMRIHSSYIVSRKYVTSINTRRVEMINGDIIPVGKTYREKINI